MKASCWNHIKNGKNVKLETTVEEIEVSDKIVFLHLGCGHDAALVFGGSDMTIYMDIKKKRSMKSNG